MRVLAVPAVLAVLLLLLHASARFRQSQGQEQHSPQNARSSTVEQSPLLGIERPSNYEQNLARQLLIHIQARWQALEAGHRHLSGSSHSSGDSQLSPRHSTTRGRLRQLATLPQIQKHHAEGHSDRSEQSSSVQQRSLRRTQSRGRGGVADSLERTLSEGNSDRCSNDGCKSEGIEGWAVNTMAGVVIGVTAVLCFGPAFLVLCFLQRLCCFSSGGCVDRCIVHFVGNSEHYADAIDGDSPGIRSSQAGSLLDGSMRPERPTSAQLRGRLSIAQAAAAVPSSHGKGKPGDQRRLTRTASFGSGRFSSVADIIAHAQQAADRVIAKEAAGTAGVPLQKSATPPPAGTRKNRAGSISVPSPLLALSQSSKREQDAGGVEMVSNPGGGKHARNGSGDAVGTPGLDAPSTITRPNSSSLPKDVDAEEAGAGGTVVVSPLQANRVPSPIRVAAPEADSKASSRGKSSDAQVSLVAPPSTLSPRHSRGLLAQLHRSGSTRFFADAPVNAVGPLEDSKQTAAVQPWNGDDGSSMGTSDVRTGTAEDAESIHELESPVPSARGSPRRQGKLGALPRLSVAPGGSAAPGSVFSLLRGADSGSVGSDGPIKRKQRASLVLAAGEGGKGHMSALKQGGFITANPLRQATAGAASRQRRRSAILAAASAGASSPAWNAARRGSGHSSSPKHRRHSSITVGAQPHVHQVRRDSSLSDADIGAQRVAGDGGSDSGSELGEAGAQTVFLGLSPPQRGMAGGSPDHVTLSLGGHRQGSAEAVDGDEEANPPVPAQRKRSNSLGAADAAGIQRHVGIGMPAVLSLSRRASAGELYSLEAIPEGSGRPISGDSRAYALAAARESQPSPTGLSGTETPTTLDDDRSSWL